MRIYGGKSAGPAWAGPHPGLGGGSPVGLPGLVLAPLSLPSLCCIQTHKAGLMDSWYREEICFALVFF